MATTGLFAGLIVMHWYENQSIKRREAQIGQRGFTLLEVLLVLLILGFLAAMVYPAAGVFNTKERERITLKKIETIRHAIVGAPDRFDENGRRIIGGYVGDMGEWPDLYEAAPECKNSTCSDFDPQGDAAELESSNYYFRPTGHFSGTHWVWDSPFRRLTDDTSGNCYDHIGGLSTENEGQPIGLWSDDPIGDGEDDRLDPDHWHGPYLVPPTDSRPEDAEQFAKSDSDYEAIEEIDEEGGYAELEESHPEYHDEKEAFRLRQTSGRLEDGWNRALRFFISDDPERDDATIFWIISEGADGKGTYPNKGSWASLSGWTNDADDTMSTAYDADASDPKGYNPDAEYNEDNIVIKLHSYEWQTIIEERNEAKRLETERKFASIRRALVGDATAAEGGFNRGFTGSMGCWPALFQWEDNDTEEDSTDDVWDNEDNSTDTAVAYTKGSPRTLWTAAPSSSDDDTLVSPVAATYGFGWIGPYLPAPSRNTKDQILLDAWGHTIFFFLDTGDDETRNTKDDRLLILSPGPDGKFDFLDTDTNDDGDNDYLEADSPTEEIDLDDYDAADSNGYNDDNVIMEIDGTDWLPALLSLNLRVLHATTNSTKAMFIRGCEWSEDTATYTTEVLTASSLSDEDDDGDENDWALTSGFAYDADSDPPAISGNRQLIVWNDSDSDGALSSGEAYVMVPVTLYVSQDLNTTLRTITIDTDTDLTQSW